MKILFTKSLDKEKVSEKLGTDFSVDFVEVIHTEILKTKTFGLKNNSLIFTSVNGVKAFFKNGFEPNENFTEPKNYNKIYVVGSQTKKELRKHNFGAFKLCKNASELSQFIVENSVNEKFLHFSVILRLIFWTKGFLCRIFLTKNSLFIKRNYCIRKSMRNIRRLFFSVRVEFVVLQSLIVWMA